MVRRIRIFACVAGAALAGVLFSAESRPGMLIDQNTLAIVSGNLNATYRSIASDLSAVLDAGRGVNPDDREQLFLDFLEAGI